MVAEPTSLIDAFIADQQHLTAVERFSALHDRHAELAPVQRYSHLLPASPPQSGQQYSFEVDLDRCSGCKACVAACHSLNGLDESETWRDVGLLVSAKKRPAHVPAPAVQHVTTACHHCVDPACLNGCPVLAYDKDPVTGIVRHLDDQCIGCQYCVLKCPYDAPKYNSRLGIVRKCDMCSARLQVGEAPACAQACPNEAIKITLVDVESVSIGFRQRSSSFLAAAPAPQYTLPTTRYVSRADAVAGLIAADAKALRVQPAHTPLVLMLVLSQAAIGLAGVAAVSSGQRSALIGAIALLVASMTASIFHLGKPMGAWRVFLGVRRSWLSREILVFSAVLPLLAVSLLIPALTTVALLCGLVGVFCSGMIYHDTQRELWRLPRSLGLFLGTSGLLGGAGALALGVNQSVALTIIFVAAVLKLGIEIGILRHVVDRSLTPLRKTALLITTKLQPWVWIRLLCVVIGGVALPLATTYLHGSAHIGVATLSFLLLLAGEFAERVLFFRGVDAPKMPGGPAQ